MLRRIYRKRICRETLYPLVRQLATEGIPVVVSCRVLKLAPQPYDRWLHQPVPQADLAACRTNAIFDAHQDDPEFGHRFLADGAKASGQPMADRTAWRICQGNPWFSAFGTQKARGTSVRPGPAVHNDLVQRDFTAERPTQLWLTDMTAHHTA